MVCHLTMAASSVCSFTCECLFFSGGMGLILIRFPLSMCNLKRCYMMQDLLANAKCSLLVAKDPEDRTDLVIIVHGDAISVSLTSSITSTFSLLIPYLLRI